MNLRHITRFTYEFTNFQGWRVAISRQGATLARYFSDKQYGSPEEAREQALTFRDMVLAEINQNPGKTREILYKYRVKSRKLQQTEEPESELRTGQNKQKVATGELPSVDISRTMLANLRKLCRYLQMDSAGLLKCSLYLFMLQSGTTNALQQFTGVPAPAETEMNKLVSETNLQRIIDLLENNSPPAGMSSDVPNELYSTPEHVEDEPQVPDKEIRTKKSGPTMHNTSPPFYSSEETSSQPAQHSQQLEPHNVATNLMPPRPSPPASPFQPDTATTQHPLSQHTPLPHSLQKRGIARSYTHHHKPTRIAMGLEYADSRPPNAI